MVGVSVCEFGATRVLPMMSFFTSEPPHTELGSPVPLGEGSVPSGCALGCLLTHAFLREELLALRFEGS